MESIMLSIITEEMIMTIQSHATKSGIVKPRLKGFKSLLTHQVCRAACERFPVLIHQFHLPGGGSQGSDDPKADGREARTFIDRQAGTGRVDRVDQDKFATHFSSLPGKPKGVGGFVQQ
jgi:hypothetical protein